MALNASMMPNDGWFWSLVRYVIWRCNFLFALFLKLKYELFGLSRVVHLASSATRCRHIIKVFLAYGSSTRLERLPIFIFDRRVEIFDLRAANHVRCLHLNQTLTLALLHLVII